MQNARIELLKGMAIFGAVRDDILVFLLERSPTVTAQKDSFFFREGDQGPSMYILESGSVAVLKSWRGEERLLRKLKTGDCFGEMALMDMQSRSASVRALEDCGAIELSASSLFELYEKDLEQFALVQMNMGREVSRRLRDIDERLFEVMMQSPAIETGDLLRFL